MLRRACSLRSLRFVLWVTGSLLPLLSAEARAGTTFTDVTHAAGLSYIQHVPPPPPACVVGSMACDADRMTGGAAVADVDGDGCVDVFVTRFDAHDLLFRNDCEGSFVDATVGSGLDVYSSHSNGAAFGDIDNDGDPDLFVSTIGSGTDGVNDRFYLFINDGSGHFTEEALPRGAAVASTQPRLAWSASFGDFDRDGYLDLHVTEWFQSLHSRLLRNRGAAAPGHFEDVTQAVGLDFAGVHGFASTFVDLDDDGWQDLAVAADFGTSRLFWNDAGHFSDGTLAAKVGTDENGMGSTFGDFDADGDLDWFVTSIWDPDDPCASGNCMWGPSGNRLYRNEGGRVFSDATDLAGVRNGDWGWGAAFFDLDNDTDLDLVMTNGIVLEHTTIEDAFNADRMRVFENDGSGVMRENAGESGIDDTASGKGLLAFDYDRDGDQDLLVINNAGGARLYRNDLLPDRSARDRRWLQLEVVGSTSNRDGVGARVELWRAPQEAPQVREVGVSSHFLGQGENVLHFGLGAGSETVARLRVTFPASGRVIEWNDVATNRRHRLREVTPSCGLGGAETMMALALAFGIRRSRAASGG